MVNETQKKILVVEDDAIVALDVQEALRAIGYTIVGHAMTAQDAIGLAVETRPDLVLMDIVLKGPQDGIFAATEIHNTTKIPVVFLSGLGDESTLQRAKIANPYAYLLKPFDTDELRLTVEIALHRAALDQKPLPEERDESEQVAFESVRVDADARARAEILKATRLFSAVTEQILLRAADAAMVRELNAGTYLSFGESDEPHVGIVISGRVAAIRGTEGGKELIVGLLGAGECYGLRLLTGTTDDDVVVRAQIDSKVLTVSATVLKQLMHESTAMATNVATELAVRLQKAHKLASSLAHSKVEHRIVSTLLTLLPEFGKSSSQSPAMRIYITRKELAELTGTTPETAIRTTKHLEREGFLDLTRPGIIKVVDPRRLATLISN